MEIEASGNLGEAEISEFRGISDRRRNQELYGRSILELKKAHARHGDAVARGVLDEVHSFVRQVQ